MLVKSGRKYGKKGRKKALKDIKKDYYETKRMDGKKGKGVDMRTNAEQMAREKRMKQLLKSLKSKKKKGM